MKKFLIALMIIALIAQPVLAKDVTVIYNFPDDTSDDVQETITLEEDANSFHALITVADNQGLSLNMTYYSSFDSWFINGVNGVDGNAEQYWHFWVNNEASAVGIGTHIPEDKEIGRASCRERV